MTPEIVTALASLAPLVVAIGGIAAVHYRYRGAREQAIEEAKHEAREAFEELFREERSLRSTDRDRHIAELDRRDAAHRAEIETIERDSEKRCAERVDVVRRFAHAEIEKLEAKLAEAEGKLERAAEQLAHVPRIVREVARLVAQLDPYRTPTRTELAALREALARGGMTPSDINGLIAVRGVAT